MDKNIGELIATYLLETNPAKQIHPQLAAWLEETPSNRAMFEEYKKIWQEINPGYAAVEFDSAQAWEKINRINLQKKEQRRWLLNVGYTVAGVAASLLIVFSLFQTGYIERPAQIVEVNTVTANGNRSEIVLPDGTHVKLNTGTTLRYIYDKKKKTREVHFEGEAFFEVAKSNLPFIIHTPDQLNVEVVGTTFTVSAYQEDELFLVSLLEGTVAVGDAMTKWTMAPGEIVSYNRTTKNMQRLDKDVNQMYGWMDNKLYMDNMPLATVCKTLERWYDVKITLAAGLGESASYTGVLKEDNIIDVLNALCSLSNIKYEVNGRHISINPK